MHRKPGVFNYIGLALCLLLLVACGKKDGKESQTQLGQIQESQSQESQSQESQIQESQTQESQSQESQTEQAQSQMTQLEESQSQTEQQGQSQEPVSNTPYVPSVPAQSGVGISYEVDASAPWIAIDPGHQEHGNSDREPIGPGASETKAKVASGTQGRVTGLPEYQLTLTVSLQLRDALMKEGYNVLMIRETNNVDISNAERAILANEKKVAAFVRIHADGAENTSASGITLLCQTAHNPFCGSQYTASRSLCDKLSDAMIKATGANNRGVSEVDTMSGINWCQVPVAIVEMGFMTNESEDRLMQTSDYQAKLVDGMVKGLKAFLE